MKLKIKHTLIGIIFALTGLVLSFVGILAGIGGSVSADALADKTTDLILFLIVGGIVAWVLTKK